MDHLFDTYVSLLNPLQAWLRVNFSEKDSVLEKKAFDTLRGLLPMSTLGQVALRGNAQAFEYLINRTTRHPLGELRWFASDLKRELDKEIPSLLLRVSDEKSQDYQTYLNRRYDNVRKLVPEEIQSVPHAEVRLVEFDPDSEVKILAGILFQQSHGTWDQAVERARVLSEDARREVLDAYVPERKGRWYKVGRAFENAYMRFEIVMDAGSYRDLHRHRMMTQERQTFSAHHGFATPLELVEAGLAEPFQEAIDRATQLFRKTRVGGSRSRAVCGAARLPDAVLSVAELPSAILEAELRTVSQGHPDYRFIEHEKYRLIKEKFPLIASYMLVDTADYAVARRGTEERIIEKEKRIMDELRKKR
jgi:hypothetical protein